MYSVYARKLYVVRWPTSIHCVSKNDTDVAHYNFNAHQPILVILTEMLRECAIKW